MRKCYIYAIKNISNNKRYIGSSIHLLIRLRTHFQQLRDNIHYSEKLQNAYNKHGKDKFITEILEEFDLLEKDRNEVEMNYINQYNSYINGYNGIKDAVVNITEKNYSLEKRKIVGQKISKAKKGRIPKNWEAMVESRCKPILQLKDGIVINEFKSAREAERITGISCQYIYIFLRSNAKKSSKYPGITWKLK